MIWRTREKPQTAEPPHTALHTPRLTLRPARLSDYPQWAQVRGKNRAYLKPYEPAWPDECLTREFFTRRIRRLGDDWAQDRGYAFVIVGKNDDALIGGININNVSRGAANFASLGYWLDQDLQGQGLMTEAGLGVLHYAFTSLHLQRMNAATLVHNKKSRAMLERLGFAEEGFAKAFIQIDGRRQDHVLFGLNATDFLRTS